MYGDALLAAGELDGAIEHMQAALRLAPSIADGHVNLGIALGSKGRLEEAVAQFRIALQAENTAKIHYNLGFALAKLGRSDEALREYESALTIDPDHAPAHAKLGAALCSRGKLDEGAAHLERALAIRPNDIEARRSLARARTQQDRVEEGIAAYREILRRSPRDVDAARNIAWIRATHADPAHRNGAEAVRLAEQARDAAPHEDHAVLGTLAAAYAEVGRYDDAVVACTRAIDLAKAAGDAKVRDELEAQLACYRTRRPFHLPT